MCIPLSCAGHNVSGLFLVGYCGLWLISTVLLLFNFLTIYMVVTSLLHATCNTKFTIVIFVDTGILIRCDI